MAEFPDPVELLRGVLASRLGPRMKTALALVLEGESCRQACTAAGLLAIADASLRWQAFSPAAGPRRGLT